MVTTAALVVITLAVLTSRVHSYGDGAPDNTCYAMYPKHSNAAGQTGPMPYDVEISPQAFSDGSTVKITVTATDKDRRFQGIQMGARRATGNLEEFVGQFTSFPVDKIKAFSCFGGFHNMITHRNHRHVTTLELQWNAPVDHVGDVNFWTIVLEDYDTFWVSDNVTLKAANQSLPSVPPKFPAIATTPLVNETDFSLCGETKGCFLYPRICSGHDCVAAASYEYRNKTGDYLVELFTKVGPNYLAIGFSHDDDMGNDFTVACVASPEHMNVQQGWNPERWNERQFTQSISDLQVLQKDGEIHCRFVMSAHQPVYVINQTASSYQASQRDFDFDEPWYIMLAWGKAMGDSEVIAEHEEMPAVTSSSVDIKEKTISYGSAFGILVKLHGCFMMIAWILLTGIVTVIARHYKDWLPERRLFSNKIWFQIHRTLAILVAGLTILGLALVLVHAGPGISSKAAYHAICGIAVVACVCLQVIFGFLRPGPGSKRRKIFNWGHRVLGQVSHILAAATMFLAFEMKYVTSDLRHVGYIILAVWLSCQVMWHMAFEIYSICHLRKTYALMEYDMDAIDAMTQEKQKSSALDCILITVYVLCLLILTAAVMVFFLLY